MFIKRARHYISELEVGPSNHAIPSTSTPKKCGSRDYQDDVVRWFALATVVWESAMGVTVKGFTDATGDRDKNIALAIARADRVRSMLVANGVARQRIRVMYCSTCYVATNDTEEGRRRNRRVEVALRAKDDRRSESPQSLIFAMNSSQ
jgi:hypothetical protein